MIFSTMGSFVLFAFFFVLFSDVNSESRTGCYKFAFASDFQESQCVAAKTWYLYAASKPCENCCVKRTLSYSSPDIMDITQEIKNGTSTTSTTFTITQLKPDPKYDMGEGNFYHVLAGTDCVTVAVFYDTRADELFVFSSQMNQTEHFVQSLKGVQMCDLKMYPYNPDVNCQGM